MKPLLTILLLAGLAVTAHAQPVEGMTPAELVSRSINFTNIGNSARGTPTIGWRIPEDGWAPLVRERIAPLLAEAGISRQWFHNPFGAPAGKRMQWTMRQQLEAINKDHKALTTFNEVQSRLISGDYTFGRKIKVVYYFGDAQTDDILVPLLEAGQMAAYERQWMYAIQPALDLAKRYPGMVAIGADSASDVPRDHPHARLMRRVADTGIEVIIEPRWRSDSEWLHAFSLWNRWRQDQDGFDRSNPETHPQPVPRAKNSDIRGNRYAFYRSGHDLRKTTFDHLRRVFEAGATPVTQLGNLHRAAERAEKQDDEDRGQP